MADDSHGVQVERLRELVEHWRTRYDWRATERRLNALPQFVTTIDGVDIHFLHIRAKRQSQLDAVHTPEPLPLLMTHGWPGSIVEFGKVIEPLTAPTAHGGRADDAFDLVLPSLPGHGFSGKPTGPGWDRHRVARAWHTLVTRLGYTHYVAQGGDWGAVTNSATSSARFYWENWGLALYAVEIDIPVGVTVFPREIYRAPRSWAELAYRKLAYWNEAEKGGHFGAFERPEIFVREVRGRLQV